MNLELYPSQVESSERISEQLDRTGKVAIFGPVGVGKATIGKKVLHDWASRDEIRKVVTIPCDDLESIDEIVVALLSASGFRLVDHEPPELVSRLNRHDGIGFLLDRIKPELLSELWSLGVSDHHVFVGCVSRSTSGIQIEPLTSEEAVDLLLRTANQAVEGWRDDAESRKLVEQLDRLPGAIVVAAGRSSMMSPPQLLERLHLLHMPSPFESAIAFCLESLGNDESRSLVALAQFGGAFDLESMEYMLRGLVSEPVSVFGTLLASSLVTKTDKGFFLLQTVRSHLQHHQKLREDDAENFVNLMCESPSKIDRKPNLLRALSLAKGECFSTLSAQLCELAAETGDFRLRRDVLGKWGDEADPRFAWHQGLSNFSGDELENAAEWFERAAQGGIGSAWAMQVEALRVSGQAQLALATVQRVPRLLQQSRHLIAVRAACEIDCGLLDDARSSMTNFLSAPDDELEDDRVRGYRRAAYVHYFLGNKKEQRRMIERAVVASEDCRNGAWKTITSVALADCDLAERKYAKSVEQYEKILHDLPAAGLTRLEGTVFGNLGGAWHRMGALDDARGAYARALEIHRRTGNRLYERDIMFAFGALEFECHHDNAAISLFQSALELAVESESLTDEGGLLLAISWCALGSSIEQDVVDLASTADERFASVGEHENGWRAVCQATRRLAGGEDVESVLRDALDNFPIEREIVATLESKQPVAVASSQLYVRLTQILSSRMFGEPKSEVSIALVWDSEKFEFKFGDVEGSLRRRKALRLILGHLVAKRVSEPGSGADVFEMFEIGWPGEEVHPETAAERVYWAVRELRKLGLGDVIVTSDSGYLVSEGFDVSYV